jgi:hypothetical protein
VAMDSAGQKLLYVYFEQEPGRRAAAKLEHEQGRIIVGGRTVIHPMSWRVREAIGA